MRQDLPTLGVPAAVLMLLGGLVVLQTYGWFAAFGVGVSILLGAAWLGLWGLALWAVGRPLADRLLGASDSLLEELVLSLGLGAVVFMAWAGALGTVGLLYPPLLILPLGAAASVGAVQAWRRRGSPALAWSPLWLPLLAAAAITGLAALTLSPLYDVWHYHLAFPEHWLREAHIHVAPRNLFSFMPANMGLLYVYALAGPGPWGAQLLHWLMGAIAAAASAALAGRLVPENRARLSAAALFVATPSMVAVASEALADLGTAAFCGAAWLALLAGLDRPRRRMRSAVTAGLLAGAAAGTKILALVTVLAPLAAVSLWLWWRAGEPGARLRRAVAVTSVLVVAAAAVFAPWALRNLWLTGNPFYPVLHHTMSALGFAAQAPPLVSQLTPSSHGYEALWSALSLRSFAPLGTGGDLGPLYLWLLPVWLFASWRWGRGTLARPLLAGFALCVAAWAASRPLGRYLLPGLVLAAAGCGAALWQLTSEWRRAARWGLWGVVGLLMAANLNPARTGYAVARIACTLGDELESTLLDRLVSCHPAFRQANSILPEDAVVLLVGEARSLGLERRVVVEDPFCRPLLVELAEQSDSAEQIAETLSRMSVTHLLLNHHEALRVAHMNGRETYLECSSSVAQARLTGFFNRHTRVLWAEAGVEIRRLDS